MLSLFVLAGSNGACCAREFDVDVTPCDPEGAAAPASKDAGTMRAAAVVNDIVISTYDLDQRVKLMMVTSGAQGPDTAKRLRPQVLRQLVDELLQLQESQK